MNPVAIGLWLFCAAVGFLINGLTGAVTGLALGIGMSLVAEIFG